MEKLWAIILALFFGIEQTAYFGWHKAPQSDAEIICDGISILIMVVAIK